MRKKSNIPFLISACIFILSLIAMGAYFLTIKSEEKKLHIVRNKINAEASEKEMNTEKGKEEGLDYYIIDGVAVQEKFKDLYISNNDFIGWIKIDGTPIDYPVMYTPNDEQFYLHRDFDKNYSFGGCIFTGLGSSIEGPSDNIITYGHHMIDSSMYHDIDKYEDEEYYKKHRYIKFDTLRQTGTYEVIAAYRTEVHSVEEKYQGFEYWKFTKAKNEKDFEDFVNNSKALTPYTIDSTAKYGDHLLTLSTCAYHTTNGRFVVVAKRISGKEIDFEKKEIEEIRSEK